MGGEKQRISIARCRISVVLITARSIPPTGGRPAGDHELVKPQDQISAPPAIICVPTIGARQRTTPTGKPGGCGRAAQHTRSIVRLWTGTATGTGGSMVVQNESLETLPAL